MVPQVPIVSRPDILTVLTAHSLYGSLILVDLNRSSKLYVRASTAIPPCPATKPRSILDPHKQSGLAKQKAPTQSHHPVRSLPNLDDSAIKALRRMLASEVGDAARRWTQISPTPLLGHSGGGEAAQPVTSPPSQSKSSSFAANA